MPSKEALNYAFSLPVSPFDEVARVLPVHWQPLLDSSQDLRKGHNSQPSRDDKTASHSIIQLYCTVCCGGLPC